MKTILKALILAGVFGLAYLIGVITLEYFRPYQKLPMGRVRCDAGRRG